MRKIVLVGGCFDVLHFGHIKFLKEAKQLGDFLIVALESDENTRRLKGKERPFHSQNQRAEILESLRFVDQVIRLPEMKNDSDYRKLVQKVAPDIIAVTKGDPNIKKKEVHAADVGAKIIQLNIIENISTSKITKLLGIE